MSLPDPYSNLEAFIEQDQVDWMGDGVLCQLVTVMMSDDVCQLEPAVCGLTAGEARELAFQLLCVAEHSERLTRGREQER